MEALDEDGWRALVELHGPRVWAVARGFRLNTADADDVFQTAWLNLAEHLDDIRDAEKVSAWLVTAARWECLRVLRVRPPLPVRWLPDVVPDGLDHGVVADERDRQLWLAFQALPERCQRLLRLFAYAPEFTYEQLADAVGLPADSVGQTKTRCLRTLRTKLDGSLFDRIDPMPEVLARPSRHPVARFAVQTEGETRNAHTTLCFGNSRHTVHVEIGTALTGVVLPRADVQVWWPDGMISADVDRNGLFKADAPQGPVRLSVEGVVTDWFVR